MSSAKLTPLKVGRFELRKTTISGITGWEAKVRPLSPADVHVMKDFDIGYISVFDEYDHVVIPKGFYSLPAVVDGLPVISFEDCFERLDKRVKKIVVDSIDLTDVDMSFAINCDEMFDRDVFNDTSNIELNWKSIRKIETANAMFYGCSGITEIGIAMSDLSNLRIAVNMFHGCSNLLEMDLSACNLDKLEQAQGCLIIARLQRR